MTAALSVLGGVPVWRVVATTRSAAGLTGPQVDPSRADLDAVIAHLCGGRLDGSDRGDVRAGWCAHLWTCASTASRGDSTKSLRVSYMPSTLVPGERSLLAE